MEDLKGKAIRGGAVNLVGQGAGLVLRLLSIVILARILDPADYGIVGMVTAVTSFYDLFTSGGLSVATIQRAEITHQQISNLFWVNVLIGVALALLCIASAPVLAVVYHEPRVFWITIVMSLGFILGAATTQHYALLQRDLRYVTLVTLDIVFQAINIGAAVVLALIGFGYWALVIAPLVAASVNLVGVWSAAAWIPGRPRRGAGSMSMLSFGGTLTLNKFVTYISFNADKVLLGRFWGADALGLYGRAYQLLNIPTFAINAAIGNVALAALSRLQNDPERLRRYFLKGYSLALSLTVPITAFCATFAETIILVALGPKWAEVAPIFRLLAPTILIFGIINPTWWLLVSTGRQKRSLHIALAMAPLVIAAYFIGLPYGATGVAAGFSSAMTLWVVPHLFWALHGTGVTPKDLLLAAGRPLLAGVVASAVALGAHTYLDEISPAFLRLAISGLVMASVYFGMLLFVLGQKDTYIDLLKELGLGWPLGRAAVAEK